LQELSNYQKAHVFPALPSLLEFLGFVFCFGNLLAGPVIEFRDYQMWVRQEGPWAPSARKVPWTGDFKAVSCEIMQSVNRSTCVSRAVGVTNSMAVSARKVPWTGDFKAVSEGAPCCNLST
jgi:hypothetical protein